MFSNYLLKIMKIYKNKEYSSQFYLEYQRKDKKIGWDVYFFVFFYCLNVDID